eukprot:Phypoly_transcript_07250.p1 GENE.Phypoly_transcript_07250~~Phypoly_transcript_07250.p1  ORF type:complete len:188 (+),score=21.53 Phypoly_transcript_07250:311-874(+)
MLESATLLSLLMAFTLYALIVKNIDHSIMEDLYYKKYLAFIWIPTLLIPLFCLAERNKRMDEGICKMTSPRTVIFRVCNLLLPLLAQVSHSFLNVFSNFLFQNTFSRPFFSYNTMFFFLSPSLVLLLLAIFQSPKFKVPKSAILKSRNHKTPKSQVLHAMQQKKSAQLQNLPNLKLKISKLPFQIAK